MRHLIPSGTTLAAALAAAACAPAPRPDLPPPAAPLAAGPSAAALPGQPAEASPKASASAPAAAQAGGAQPAPLPALPGAAQLKIEAARWLCQAVYQRGLKTAQVGCESCPGGAAPADGATREAPPTRRIEAAFSGSFTSPGKDQVALVLDGCSGEGATVAFAERDGGRFRLVSRLGGAKPSGCQVLRSPSGRDLLVCLYPGERAAPIEALGVGRRLGSSAWSLSAIEPTGAEGRAKTTLLASGSTLDGPCQAAPAGTEIVDVALEGWGASEPSASSPGSLWLEITAARAKAGPSFAAACDAEQRRLEKLTSHPSASASSALQALVRPRKARLELSFEGDRLAPTAASTKAARSTPGLRLGPDAAGEATGPGR